jgi:hypothetical protein
MLYYEHSFLAVCAFMGNQDVDGLLKQFIQNAIAQEPESSGRIAAVDCIIALADQLPGILSELRLDAGLRVYYYDALKRTEKSLNRTIQKFPQTYNLELAEAGAELVRKKFVNWYNLILKRDCIDLWREQKNRPKPVELDRPIGEDGDLVGDIVADSDNPSPLEKAIQEENKRILQEVRHDFDKWLRELEDCRSNQHPSCNCGELYRRRILREPPQRWNDIARELNIPFGTITAHWHNHCKPLLREIAERFGYKLED